MIRPLGLFVALIGVVAAAGVLQAREATRALSAPHERLLYLRSGQAADRLFLAFDALAADVYWMRAIQHYGRDRRSPDREGRFEQLLPLLDLTTTLDPNFVAAYRVGAILLSLEPPNGPGRPDLAIGLLEKGARESPLRWEYLLDIGFIHYWHGDDRLQAADWFERAAALPDAPLWIGQVAAATRVEGGDRSGARRLLAGLLASDAPAVRAAAERSLAQVDALDIADALSAVVERYTREEGTPRRGWEDLVARGYLPAVPVDSTGVPFALDPATGLVTIGAASTLLPLPGALRQP